MKFIQITILSVTLFSLAAFASDNYVIIYGDTVQPREGQALDAVCYNNKEYVIIEVEEKGRKIKKIEVDAHRPWFKLAYKGHCTGLPGVSSKQAILENSSPINRKYLQQGKAKYFDKIKTHQDFDDNLGEFYAEIKADDFEPDFNSVTHKWPLGNNFFLIEQCFTVSAKTKSYPSYKKGFIFGEKYRREIVSDKFNKVLTDSELNLTSVYCECDGNPPPTCKSISNVTDINGNTKYEIMDQREEPEGEQIELKEFDGESLKTVFKMCTGDFSHPLNTFKCR